MNNKRVLMVSLVISIVLVGLIIALNTIQYYETSSGEQFQIPQIESKDIVGKATAAATQGQNYGTLDMEDPKSGMSNLQVKVCGVGEEEEEEEEEEES
ncbi:hypothetical protein ACFLZX_01740 [Nanoarchaeota archaeon]